jgi:hypothetical protein
MCASWQLLYQLDDKVMCQQQDRVGIERALMIETTDITAWDKRWAAWAEWATT